MVCGVGLSKRDGTDFIRAAGGLLFASGAVALLIRKSGHHEWSHFARFLTVAVPAVVLYSLALREREPAPSASRRPSQAMLMVSAILLVPVACFEFLDWVEASTRHLLYDAAVFALTSLLAAYAAKRARVPYCALLAGLSLLLTWLIVWEKILGHPSANTYRWLLIAAGALLALAAWTLARTSSTGASEVATAGGLAAVAAGVLGVIVGAFVGLARSIGSAFGAGPSSVVSSATIAPAAHISARHGPPPGRHPFSGSRPLLRHHALPTPHLPPSLSVIHVSGLQHFGWDLYLVIVSLALVWTGSRARSRGLGYVGAFGLAAFLISVGVQITRIESGQAGGGAIVGWPLALLLVGVVGLALPALSRGES